MIIILPPPPPENCVMIKNTQFCEKQDVPPATEHLVGWTIIGVLIIGSIIGFFAGDDVGDKIAASLMFSLIIATVIAFGGFIFSMITA